jgi:hypothetical protein
MTQSEVPRRRKPTPGERFGAGALSIGAFERSRWRLRRTRDLWVLNGLWGCEGGRLGSCAGAE